MAYQIPKTQVLKFDKSKQFKDLKVDLVKTFDNDTDINNELQTLTDRQVCDKLIYYVKKKNRDVVFRILSLRDIDINFTDCKGNSPLHYAVYYGEIDITGKLLYYGADNNFLNKYEETAIQAGRVSIEENIKNKKYIKNNINIEKCITQCEVSNGRLDIDELKGNPNVISIRANLNKIQETNKEEILKNIVLNARNIIHNKKIIIDVFNIIFGLAQENSLFLGVYVDVIITILDCDRSYNKEAGTLHLLLAKTYEYYTNAIEDPIKKENQNVLKFITHFYSKNLMTKAFLFKIIDDLFYVIDQSYNSETQKLKEEECIRLLVIVLSEIKPKKGTSIVKYERMLIKYMDPSKYDIKPRLRFLIQDYNDL
jgi:hypothetical protein